MYDVSVITPSYNRAYLLPRVWKSLSSQKSSFEWVIVDDGSIDNTKEVVDSFYGSNIKYTALKKNSGVNAARNEGVRVANGRYVIFLDSDDELYPNGIATIIQIMDSVKPKIGVVAFTCINAETGQPISELHDGAVYNEFDIVCGNALRGGDKSLIYKREVFDEFLLPEAFRGCEQIFVYGVSKKWDFYMVNKPMSVVHRQSDNLSNAKSMVERSLDIAKSYEILIQNHKKILDVNPQAKFNFLKRALYRYGVAGAKGDVFRVYMKTLSNHRIKNVLLASFLMAFCLFMPKHFEIWRMKLINRQFGGEKP